MNKNLRFSLLFAVLICFSIPIYAQLSKGGTPKGFSPDVDQNIPVERMPAFDVNAMLKEDDVFNAKGDRPYRFGNNFDVQINPSNSGRWLTLADGGRLWQTEIYSPGAYSINLQFSYYNLPPDAEMFVYNKSRDMVLGAFSYINNQDDYLFATDLVAGERIIVEYYEPAQVAGLGQFNISMVTHAYRDVFKLAKGFGTSGACQFNVACPLSLGWENEINSVVMLVSGGNGFCTGALVNNTAMDGKPYVLTANHCGSSGFGSWVFRFNWQSATCTNPASSPSFLSLTGAVQRASSAGSDFSLVEITGGLSGGTIPQNYNPFFAGWNNVNAPADSSFCIHHPDGDIKKFSIAANATVSATYSGAQTWRVGQWTSGCTEPGSSGSPLFDQDHLIIGQLYGGPSACGAPPSNMVDYFGKFSTSWLGGGSQSSQLKFWLDPSNSGTTSLPGYDPYAVVYQNDASVFTILSPTNGLNTCNTSITPVVRLKNYGVQPLTGVNINYKIDNATPSVFNWTGNLNQNATADITLPVLSGIAVGTHTLTVFTSDPNGVADSNANNDQKVISFTIATPTPMLNLPAFNGADVPFPGTNWSISNPDNNTTWIRATNIGGFGTSNSCFKMDFFSNDLSGQSDYIVTPYFNFAAATSPLQMIFNLAHKHYSAGIRDSLIVSITTNCGETWTRLYGKGGLYLNTTIDSLPQQTSFTPNATQWRKETINLDSYIGQADVRLRLQAKSAFGNNIYVDDINIGTNVAGIQEVTTPSVKVFPNPSSGTVNLDLSNLAGKKGMLSITDETGREVYRLQMNNPTETITLDLAHGLYMAIITTDNSQMFTRFIVLDR